MRGKDFYTNAHLVVAAIRVLEHQNNTPPSIDKICQTLLFSLEQGNRICRKLKEAGILEIIEGTYGTKLFIRNHQKLEEIPRDSKGSKLEEELKKFQNTKKSYTQKIQAFQTEQSKRKKSLFAELDKKLKETVEKK